MWNFKFINVVTFFCLMVVSANPLQAEVCEYTTEQGKIITVPSSHAVPYKYKDSAICSQNATTRAFISSRNKEQTKEDDKEESLFRRRSNSLTPLKSRSNSLEKFDEIIKDRSINMNNSRVDHNQKFKNTHPSNDMYKGLFD